MPEPALALDSIAKSFALTAALADVSLQLFPGEIHALVGENGAGKSTLIKIITGVHQPDEGIIRLAGAPLAIADPQAAQRLGIAAIYQEPMVFPDLDVAENIFISHQGMGQLVDWRRLYREAEELIARLGVTLDVRRAASGLTLAEQQTVEIARALSLDVKVLIMDEPTASLSAHEVDRLMQIARTLKARGVAVLYISHRLDEVFDLADRVTVLRDGRHISTRPIAELTGDDLVRDMVGRAVEHFVPRTTARPRGDLLLSVRGLGHAGVFEDVDFDLHAGEVLCFSGLVGSRRTDVGLALFGIQPATTGTIMLDGEALSITTPRDAMRQGIAYVSEDRRKLGLAMALPILANVSLPSLPRLLGAFGLIDRRAERAMAEKHKERLSIRTTDVALEVGKLSGGNQQKVMLAKWLETGPRLLILDEPTRGIDVGAKTEVHAIINDLAAHGVAIIVISSDLPEVLALADRVLVMREGRQMGIFAIEDATPEAIMSLATGERQAEAA
jgi:rhamnose transport system ATP-binding protein